LIHFYKRYWRQATSPRMWGLRAVLLGLILLSTAKGQISFGGGGGQEESDCTTPLRKPGKCVGLRQCGNVIALLKRPIAQEVIRYLRGSVCGFSGRLPDVCCPKEKPVFGTPPLPPVQPPSGEQPAEQSTTAKPPPPPPVVHGGWSAWSPLSGCSVTCGDGTQFRTRSCTNPAPGPGGNPCEGEEREELPCSAPTQCGVWNAWGDWGECTVSCGGGEQVRSRTCPDNACEGEAEEKRACGTGDCPTLDLIELPRQCGQTNAGSKRIVNGAPARLNAWPWIAALGYDDPNRGNLSYLCGSTLITDKHVLTAAHCVVGGHTPVAVRLGEHVLYDDNDGASPEEYKVVKITPHERYSPRSFANDIAIVEFEKAVTYKNGIQPACLPSLSPKSFEPPSSKEKLVSEGVLIAGWGATGFRQPTSDKLLQGTISVVSEESCKEKFSAFKNVNIGPKQICALDPNNKIDACQGDSGGPLVVLKRDTNEERRYRYFLVGVVSYGYKCAEPGFPGVYTRVNEYDDWIRNVLNGTTSTE